jgi:outer membrane protein assembly factor BamD (BamD/ComL family)
LTSQIAAIREARLAIRQGNGAAALSALDGAFVQGQSGPLEQEATMARISALCLLGDRARARRTSEQFLSRYPESNLAGKIRSSCAFGDSDAP